MAELEELLVTVGVDADDVDAGVDKVSGLFDDMASKVSLAAGAAGAGLEALIRGQQDTSVQTRQLAAALGIGEDAMRDLVTETSNATFPIEDVVELMERGRQRGITGGKALQDYATFWDMVGDATGESATELGKAGVALQTVGVEAGNEKEAMAALGFVHRETTSSVKDFLSFLERTGPELQDMGVNVNDAAAVLGIMEKELGLSGRMARQEFRTAVNESDGSLKDLLKTLGISPASFEAAQEAVESSSGVIEENAGILADSKTPLEELQATFQDLLFTYMPFIEALAPLAPILIGLAVVIKSVTAVTAVWNAVTAGNPIVLIVLAVLALIAAIVLLVMHWDTVAAAVSDAFDAVEETVGSGVDWLTGKIGDGLAWLEGVWDGAWQAVEDTIADAIGSVRGFVADGIDFIIDKINILRRLPGMVAAFFRNMAVQAIMRGVRLIQWVRDLPGKIMDFFHSLPGLLKAAGRNALNALWDGLVSVWNRIARWILDRLAWLRGLWPFSPAEHGPLATHPMDEAGAGVMGDLQAGIEAGTPALLGQLRDVAEAVSMPGVQVAGPAAGAALTATSLPDVRRRGEDGAAQMPPIVPDGTRASRLLVELIQESLRTDPQFRQAVGAA